MYSYVYEYLKKIDYTKFKKIQQNKVAITGLATNPSGTPVFVKCIPKNRFLEEEYFVKHVDYEETVPNELNIMLKLQGIEGCSKFIEYKYKDFSPIIISEYLDIESGWVTMLSLNNNEALIKFVMKKIITILEQFANAGVYYRDIKKDNTMFNVYTMEVKLIDYQDSVYSENANPTSRDERGTDGYMAPEVNGSTKYNVKPSMVYSIGCLAFVLIESTYAFQDDKVSKRKQKSLEFIKSSKKAQSFIRQCTYYRPQDRMKFEDLLAHPWFNKKGNKK